MKLLQQALGDSLPESHLESIMQVFEPPKPVQRVRDNSSVLSNIARNMHAGPDDGEKPIMRYMETSDAE